MASSQYFNKEVHRDPSLREVSLFSKYQFFFVCKIEKDILGNDVYCETIIITKQITLTYR